MYLKILFNIASLLHNSIHFHSQYSRLFSSSPCGRLLRFRVLFALESNVLQALSIYLHIKIISPSRSLPHNCESAALRLCNIKTTTMMMMRRRYTYNSQHSLLQIAVAAATVADPLRFYDNQLLRLSMLTIIVFWWQVHPSRCWHWRRFWLVVALDAGRIGQQLVCWIPLTKDEPTRVGVANFRLQIKMLIFIACFRSFSLQFTSLIVWENIHKKEFFACSPSSSFNVAMCRHFRDFCV